MKIITWNCNGKFNEEILKENADIYVIQECENPAISKNDEFNEFATNYFWIGDNEYRGLWIFARDDIKLELADLDNKGLRYFIPVRVNDSFNLLGVWTNPDMEKSKVNFYPLEMTKYCDAHKDSGFFNQDMIICGDFNCDVRLKGTHAKRVYEMAEKLSEFGLVDIYHHLNDEEPGEESQATFFMYRHLDKPFHLDHVFANSEKINDLEIGDEVKWTQLSDHLPISFYLD